MEPVVKIVVGPVEYGASPFWYSKTQSLYFVNVYQAEIHKYNPETNEHAFATIDGKRPVSFVIPIDDFDNKFLIGYGPDLAAVTWDGKSKRISKIKIIENVDSTKGNVLTDGKVSPCGVLFVASSGPGNLQLKNLTLNKGGLFSFKNCEMKKLISNISFSGGMAWSKSEETFYFIDCAENRIEKYCHNRKTSELTAGCILYELKDDAFPGYLSGMTIDSEDHLWIGCFNGSQLIKIDTNTGRCTVKIEIPDCPQITSVTYGGKNFDTLFVTTAAYNVKSSYAKAGFVFQISGLNTNGCSSPPLRLIPKK